MAGANKRVPNGVNGSTNPVLSDEDGDRDARESVRINLLVQAAFAANRHIAMEADRKQVLLIRDYLQRKKEGKQQD